MFFNNIKLNYNIKILDSLFSSRNYKEINELLQGYKKNDYVFYNLIKYIRNKYLHLPDHSRLLKKKFIWLISYDKSDLTFFENFLKYYFKNQNISFLSGEYLDCYSATMSKISTKDINPKPSFEEIVQETDLYHLLMHYVNDEEYFILKTNSAFFEAPNNKYFIYPINTISYFAIIRDPFDLYSKYKNINNNQQEALEMLNHFDITRAEDHRNKNQTKYAILENKQSWSVNSKSWNDENVKDTYRGKIILYNDLISSVEEALTETIYQLKQSGVPIEINYDLIKNYVTENFINKEEIVSNISKNELKLISNGLDKSLLDDLNMYRAN